VGGFTYPGGEKTGHPKINDGDRKMMTDFLFGGKYIYIYIYVYIYGLFFKGFCG